MRQDLKIVLTFFLCVEVIHSLGYVSGWWQAWPEPRSTVEQIEALAAAAVSGHRRLPVGLLRLSGRLLRVEGCGVRQLHLDDLAPGQVYDLGRRTLGRDEIVAFAREWDPQPFHLDDVAAAASNYGGLIASGWHTVCVFMRLYADGLLARAAAMGSPGVDELRWLKPVRPGDTLAARLEVLEVRASRSRPDRGIMRARAVTLNQHGEEVLSFIATLFFKRRPAASEETAP